MVKVATVNASSAMELVDLDKARELVTQFAEYMTPANVALGVAAILTFSGLLHALPGPPCRMQAKAMGMPGWFLLCAGLLMAGSGVLYYLEPRAGLFAVSLCMGGAFATAAKMPKVMTRPGGMTFSTTFLGMAIWANNKQEPLTRIAGAICAAAFIAGVAGRIYVPGNLRIAKLLVKAEKKSDGEAKKVESASPPAKTEKDGGNVEKTKESPTAAEEKKGQLRKRADSPGAVARKN